MANFRSKVESAKALSLTILPDTAAKKTNDILDRAYKRIKVRNRYAHNPFAYSPTGQVCITRMDKAPADYDLEEVSLNEIRSATSELQKSCEEVNERIGQLQSIVPPLLVKLREAPGIRIRFAKKGAPRPKP